MILDEADEMLDMGFADDIDSILQATPVERQTVLFSATMPARINALARKYQRDPIRIQIGRSDATPGTALVRQSAYMVQRSHKPAALGRILDIEAPKATLVFCRTRTEVDQLTETMNGRGYRAEALHGGMDQPQRDRVMGRLRDGTAELLVATDVAARGLDVDTLTHVVNYDVPSAAESYVHRIGRVGRAGRQGVAITLAEPREQRLLFNIEKLTKQKIAIERVPTVADLRARQIELTVNAVREALASDDLDDYNDVLNALSGEHNMRTIALAAVKLAHEAGGATVDEAEIPDFSHKVDRGPRPDRPERGGRPGERPGQKGRPGSAGRGGTVGTGFIYLGLGRKAGIRAGRPRRHDRQREQAQRSRDRADQDHRAVLDRRGSRGEGRRRDRIAAWHLVEGQEAQRPSLHRLSSPDHLAIGHFRRSSKPGTRGDGRGCVMVGVHVGNDRFDAVIDEPLHKSHCGLDGIPLSLPGNPDGPRHDAHGVALRLHDCGLDRSDRDSVSNTADDPVEPQLVGRP